MKSSLKKIRQEKGTEYAVKKLVRQSVSEEMASGKNLNEKESKQCKIPAESILGKANIEYKKA
jgi:hypothetical protein